MAPNHTSSNYVLQFTYWGSRVGAKKSKRKGESKRASERERERKKKQEKEKQKKFSRVLGNNKNQHLCRALQF